jgi:lipooligosaccharide transport system permease protein
VTPPNSAVATAPASGRRTRPTPMPLRALSFWSYQYKRIWRSSVTTSFLYPVLYLTAMGVGLGTLVDSHAHAVDGVSYLAFLAPGLLAATTMQIGTNESTYPVMGAIKWEKTYFAMLATPLGVDDILAGQLTWIGLRLVMVSSIYLAIMAVFGVVLSFYAVAALPAAVLTGLAFAAPVCAFSATQDRDIGFTTLQRFGVIPLFLFSGTFFPVSELPGWLQPVAYATPLYHGVALCRAFVLGQVHLWPTVANFGYLIALATVGVVLARITFRRRLIV